MTLVLISHRPEVWNFGDTIIEISEGAVTMAQGIGCERRSFT